MESKKKKKKKILTNLFTNRNRFTDVKEKNKFKRLPDGKGRGKDKFGDWDWNIHTTIYEIDNKDVLYYGIAKETLSMLCNDLYGKRI